MSTGTIILILFVWACLGGAIGQMKGRPGTGLLLGAFLGIIGMLIAALLPKTVTKQASDDIKRGIPNWYPDPLKEHEMRYYNGVEWTAEVFDDGEISRDA